MKLKHSNFILLFFICFIHVAIASNIKSSKPDKCPSVAALQNIHIQKSDLIEVEAGRWACCTASGFPYYVDGKWSVKDFVGKYDTDDQWAFNLNDVRANNAEQALEENNEKLSTLVFASGPWKHMGRWSCTYHSAKNDVGALYLGS